MTKLLTSPNLERRLKIILSVFKRQKNFLQPFEAEALESVVNHIEERETTILQGHDAVQSLVCLLMFHYTEMYGSPKHASFMLRNKLNKKLPVLQDMLLSSILGSQLRELFENVDLDTISKERLLYLQNEVLNSWTMEDVKKSLQKTTLDIITNNQ